MHFKRMWINQPSTLQPYHKYHSENVLALVGGDGKTLVADGKDADFVQVAFTHGSIVSMRIDRLALSEGWRTPAV